jgi:predicted dehydrogenase
LLRAFPAILRGAVDTKPLKVALVGCGGRGSGAANQALNADPGAQLVYMADAFQDRLDTALKNLQATFKDKPDKVKVTPETSFVGLDSIDKVLASDADVVILTTPPGFRPEYFEKTVKAGKHAFVEKPIAVDAPGYRRFMEAAKLSKEKGLGVQSGFCWRSHYLERETYKRVLGGDMGTIEARMAPISRAHPG